MIATSLTTFILVYQNWRWQCWLYCSGENPLVVGCTFYHTSEAFEYRKQSQSNWSVCFAVEHPDCMQRMMHTFLISFSCSWAFFFFQEEHEPDHPIAYHRTAWLPPHCQWDYTVLLNWVVRGPASGWVHPGKAASLIWLIKVKKKCSFPESQTNSITNYVHMKIFISFVYSLVIMWLVHTTYLLEPW